MIELGNKAVGLFEALLASLPCVDTGLRLFRAFPGGFMRRAICSANDRFFLLVMFTAAIGLDGRLIPDLAVRGIVLAACEAAIAVAVLLRAEALTPEARTTFYVAVRRFLEYMLHRVFRERQTSLWSLLKFHMLPHIVNWLPKGAPSCTNSGKFEAALRIYVSRIAKRASSNQNVLRDIARYVTQRAMFDLILSKGGGALAESLRGAASLPQRRRLLDRCTETPGGCLSKVVTAPASEYVRAIRDDWVNVPGNVGHVLGSTVDFSAARFFERVFHQDFTANIDLRAVVELDPLSERLRYHQLQWHPRLSAQILHSPNSPGSLLYFICPHLPQGVLATVSR